MKARIAQHGNKDTEKSRLKTDSAVCPPTGIRILLSLASTFQWRLAKIDFRSVFLRTGTAKRDLYVIPSRESTDKGKKWLLLTASYGLVSANGKWQELGDILFNNIGLKQLVYVPRLFYKSNASGMMQLAAVKIVDDVLFARDIDVIRDTIAQTQKQYELGNVVYGPGSFYFFGLMICQDSDHNIKIHADEKIDGTSSYPFLRQRREEGHVDLNAVEAGSFRSVNSSIEWLGIAASPFCAFYARYLQQKVPSTNKSDLITQITSLRLLRKLGSTITYKRPKKKNTRSRF